MKKKGFTLVELLAVIVVLAIILAVAVPKITSIIRDATKSAFGTDARMILQQLEYKLLEDESFDVTSVTADTVTSMNISNNNYISLLVGKSNGKNYIIIEGKNKWEGLKACGNIGDMKVISITDQTTCQSVESITGILPSSLSIGDIVKVEIATGKIVPAVVTKEGASPRLVALQDLDGGTTTFGTTQVYEGSNLQTIIAERTAGHAVYLENIAAPSYQDLGFTSEPTSGVAISDITIKNSITNYANGEANFMTSSPCSSDSNAIWYVAQNTGYVYSGGVGVSRFVRVAFNLASSTKIFYGSGTTSEPYTLESSFAGSFESGTGLPNSPYQISTAQQLNNIRNDITANYVLLNDIDLNVSPYNEGTGWIPIGYFGGVLDGNGHIINSLMVNLSGSSNGGFISNMKALGEVKNVGFVSVNLKGGAYTGIIASINNGKINNSYTTGALVYAGAYLTQAGGIAGANNASGIISNVYNLANVTSTSGSNSNVAGIAGRNVGTIQNVYNVGQISIAAGDYAGGIYGGQYYTPVVSTYSYYNSETAGTMTNASWGIPKTTAEMKMQSTYENWDFTSIWGINASINNGYPYLRVFSE